MNTLQNVIDNAAAQEVATVNGRRVTRGELTLAFNAVANRSN